jgi:RNA polymerase primary sigma factor
MEDKDRDDVMERLLELGGDKKYLTFDDLNRELPDNVVSPDDIEDVLQKLEGSNIPVADSDERLLEQAAATVSDEDEDARPLRRPTQKNTRPGSTLPPRNGRGPTSDS